MGRLMSSDQVLLGDYPSGQWTRVGPNQMLVPQSVLVLPTYRAKIAMTAGMMAELLGGSRAELLGSSPAEPPGIRLLYGRLVLTPLAKAGTMIAARLRRAPRHAHFRGYRFGCRPGRPALHAPGTNPEGNAAVITAEPVCDRPATCSGSRSAARASRPNRL